MRLRLILPLVLLPLLAGCQALPGAKQDAPAAAQASPITGGEIAVTSLDGPAAPAQSPAAATDETALVPLLPVPDTMPQSDAPPAEAEPVAPPAFKTTAHLACEKRGGRWSVAGGGTAAFCQTPTKDAGKSCRRSTDCTGYCLNTSNTCAPVTPMLGCHDILNEQGRMLTQCIN
ncbi:hypothetical protein [Pseudotabrizicola alkalilacus]|uniref:Uncharacterized protein n=1 Tax=Pseudotabrizicola alkalilacus TaxID=2305252 RepID=A0A411Z2F7_9RHOB|nr:hypothetical protein [Pseudotabrizicola alkalilacus]RGP37220.1 hypothetical protein D1012_11205 [Pseudotabrizicola alkalilacus]